MEIKYERPAARGVSQLMYVGDDEALEKAAGTALAPVSPREVGIGVVCAVAALKTRGAARLATGGIALVVALRILRRLPAT